MLSIQDSTVGLLDLYKCYLLKIALYWACIRQCGTSMISGCIHPKKDVYPFLCKKCIEGAVHTSQKALYSAEKDIERG